MRAERVYRIFLRAYPAEFRGAYGREMTLVFRDRCRDAGAMGVRFWWEMVLDVARSAPPLRLARLRDSWGRGAHTREGTMKPMAILAVLIGTFEVLNSMVEGWAGGLHRDPLHLLAVVLAVVAGALLAAAGVALLRGTGGAPALARGAAAACLAVFVFMEVAARIMSVLAMLLGIGFPVAMLIFLFLKRGPGISTAAVR
jgi:hypothetical protein